MNLKTLNGFMCSVSFDMVLLRQNAAGQYTISWRVSCRSDNDNLSGKTVAHGMYGFQRGWRGNLFLQLTAESSYQ